MALPTEPIPLVAFDEIIEESWGDAVAQSLNNQTQMFDRLEWVPSSETFAPISTSTWTTWFTVGGTGNEITVPDWAVGRGVTIHVFINGIRDTGGGGDAYDLRLLLGTIEGRSIRLSAPVGVGPWFGAAWMDHFNATDPGNQVVKVEAMRLTGADKWAIDGDSDVCIDFTFHGAIG